MNKSVIVFCPNPYSLYTNTICELLIKRGYTINTIIVRKFSFLRFRDEFRRDGVRLLIKIWKKLILKENAYKDNIENLVAYRKTMQLKIKNVREFKKYQTKLIYCNTLNDKIVENVLKKNPNDLVIFTGGGIIRSNILELAHGILNCHMGVLPRYKGMDLPEWCILEDRTEELGITIHFMNQGIDTGDVLKVVKIPIGDSRDIIELRNKFEPIMVDSMVNTIDDYLSQLITPVSQSDSEKRQYFIVHSRLYEIVHKKLKLIE